jgi:ribosomal protein S18 acetylase RimI-like enzyme
VVVLHDGTSLTIRPIRPDDEPRLQALLSRLSPKTVYLRFHGQRKMLPDAELERLANVDYEARMALVATDEHRGGHNIVAVARYEVLGPDEPHVAEAAFVVEDKYQGKGLGTLLTHQLVAYARAHGVHAFLYVVHSSNDRMLHLVRHSGRVIRKRLDQGILEILVDLDGECREHGHQAMEREYVA